MFLSRLIQALTLTSIVVIRGYKKKSLSLSGAIGASIIGLIVGFTGVKFSSVLGVFFFSSSYFTKYKADLKKKIEDGYKEGGQRNWVQAFCNGFGGTLACCIILYCYGLVDVYFDYKDQPFLSSLLAAYIAHFACCNGDTWASELGVLSTSKPFLITTLRTVPTGTNGGISLLGTVASLLGGLTIGLTYYLTNIIFSNHSSQPPQHGALFLGAISGVLGSLIDSLMGATLQYSGWSSDKKMVVTAPGFQITHICGRNILDNHQVNLLSSLLTAALMGIYAKMIFSLV